MDDIRKYRDLGTAMYSWQMRFSDSKTIGKWMPKNGTKISPKTEHYPPIDDFSLSILHGTYIVSKCK